MRLLLGVFLLGVLLVSSSCFIPREAAVSALPPASYRIWIRYQPNTDKEAQFHLGVRPVPMDNGWTDLRMQRDLQRMYFAGVSVVLVEVSPQALVQEDFWERFRHFGEYAREFSLQTALFLAPSPDEPAPALERGNLLGYLRRLKLEELNCYLQEEGLPVVLVHEAFALKDGQSPREEGVRLLRVGREVPSPLVSQDSPEALESGYRWTWGGRWEKDAASSDGKWSIPRRRGESLGRQLEDARRSGCRVLLLSSWNDYREGSFLEPNSLDGEALVQALKRR
ncbi:MAG: hypothetical protein ACI4SG_05770 [Oligosphaeraceae bacterium]